MHTGVRRTAALLGVTGLLAACSGSTSPSPTPSPPVAKVGSTLITQSQFDVRLQSTFVALQQGGAPSADPTMQTSIRATVLRSLILDAIIAQEATAQGIEATDSQVQAEINTDAQQAGGMSQLESQLASAGGSMAQLQDEIRSELNEQRLENAFARQRAAAVEQTLAGGADFAATAQQYSDGTGTSSKGGDLGQLSTADLQSDDPAFAAAVKALAVGTYTHTPVRDSGGYDIIEVYAATSSMWGVRHILVAAPMPYSVQDRPAWFTGSLFTTVAQDCRAGQIHVYTHDAGADPCSGAPNLSPAPLPSLPGA
ncbi:MAG: SurA N-terminal domain-containing protein [Candidatus Dormibacteraeota bacterium]|nr:SurA N-terminal domain-containing protein [Candidatus Dormibacteraeota bacterium]